MKRVLLLILLATLALPTLRAADPATAKLPPIYDTRADGNRQIRDALLEAQRDRKRVLLQFGANWCPWCHRLYNLFRTNETVSAALRAHYVLVLIDVDKVDGAIHNQDILDRFQHPEKQGLPVLVVLDATGRSLVTQETGSLEEGKGHSPQKVLAFLEKWKTPAQTDTK